MERMSEKRKAFEENMERAHIGAPIRGDEARATTRVRPYGEMGHG